MTDPVRPEPNTRHQWLLCCSPSRTLLARRVDGDRTLLVKIYESGSPSEAAHELELGERLAGPGIARHLEVGVDPESGRPCLLQELVPGVGLDALLDAVGALPEPRAAAIALGLARVLARLAAFRDAGAPAGFVHGDVKPGNVLVDETGNGPEVTLLDLEHARPAPSGDGAPEPDFTGGTHGFAPPEAYRGARPTPAFDVFGLGAVLHAMLTGAPPFRAAAGGDAALADAVVAGRRRQGLLEGCAAALVAVVDDCVAADPAARPSAGAVAERLAAWLDAAGAAGAGDAVAEARSLALRGEPAAALERLGDQGTPTFRARLGRRARLLEVLDEPRAPDPDGPLAAVATALPAALQRIAAFLHRFPTHERVRAERARAQRATARLAVELPERVAACKRQARFDEATALCDAAARAIRLAGRLPRPGGARSARPAPTERDPLRVIAALRRDVDAAQRAHAEVEARIHAAEAHGDVDEVEEALDALAALYGGASPVVAAAKDRLHRFDFYLARIGQQVALTEELRPLFAELDVDADLRPLERFRRTDAPRSTARPRALLRAFDDLAAEFPAIAGLVAPAREALEAALRAASARAWEMIADADRMLATPPIPIRPLTAVVVRFDRMLQLDVLIDLPGRSRGALHDRIEGLRVKVEQARAERDRITRGAQEAMDRGHLTTAIYDMSRAVDRFATEAGDDRDGTGLADQFEEAKRRKREIELALARNHELAARYGELVTDPTCVPAERLSILHEREHLLSMLCANLGPERARVYAEDLRAVQLDVLREQAAEGTRRLATARDAHERLAIAQRTFDALQQAAPDGDLDPQDADRARALLREWLDLAEQTARELRGQPPAGRGEPRRGRHHGGRWGLAASVVVAVAAVVAVLRGRGDDADPVATLRAALGEPVALRTPTGERPSFDAARAVALLRDFVAELRQVAPELTEPGRRAAEAVDAIARGAAGYAGVEDALTQFDTAATDLEDASLRGVLAQFSARARRAGFVTAALRAPSAELAGKLAQDDRLRRALSAEDAGALAAQLGR